MPFLHVAICNGKIIFAPAVIKVKEPGEVGHTMEDYIYACKTDTDKCQRK